MNLKKEPIVLVGALAIVGSMLYPDLTGTQRRSQARPRSSPEFVDARAPDTALARALERDLSSFDRDLFVEPTDTRPLPPLFLSEPPLQPLAALFPPPVPGPRPALFGRYLRADATPRVVEGLFVDTLEEAGDDVALAEDGAESLLSGLGYVGTRVDDPLTAEQRAAQLESWKKSFDWVRIAGDTPKFGHLVNPDRFGLFERSKENPQPTKTNPKTGRERFVGMGPVKLPRGTVSEFKFADTAANQIELQKRHFMGELTPGQFGPAMEFAAWCVSVRHEAREALSVAEKVYRAAMRVAADDPAPQLGLARCYEAGFEFEKAFRLYGQLLETLGHVPELHARLAQLEARFRLFESAEARLRHAAEIGRSSWEVQWALGRFLLERGRFDEAREHLELAHDFEPPADRSAERAGIRWDLGRARVAVGVLDGLDGASNAFADVLRADPDSSVGRAGSLATAVLSKTAPTGSAGSAGLASGFELLVNQGLVALREGRFAEARDALLAAADADALRANVAYRALSWLAEVTGYPTDALSYIEAAYDADPTDAWTLYQRGRLYAQNDDPDGARQSFQDALDQDLGFVEALAELGQLAYDAGDHESAELYFERAVRLDPGLAAVHARRALNFLRLGDVARAEESFVASRSKSSDEPLARSGLAWVRYLRGDSQEAIRDFAALDDARRALPEEDPWRVFARAEMKRVEDHEAKEAWTDRFERLSLRNGWDIEESAGPLFSLVDGKLVCQGTFNQNEGRVRVYRSYAAPLFVSIEMDLVVRGSSRARVGVFLAKERSSRGETKVSASMSAERHPDGNLQVVYLNRTAEAEVEDIPEIPGETWWPADRTVHVRLEIIGDGSDARGRISVAGIPVRDDLNVRTLTSSGDLRVGLFAEGDNGRSVQLEVDNVEVVYRKVR